MGLFDYKVNGNDIGQLRSGTGAETVDISSTDYAVVAGKARGIYCGVLGNVKLTLLDGTQATFVSMAAGVIHPIFFSAVVKTGTTATSMIAVI